MAADVATLSDGTLLQRYTMVLFYYLTGPWKSCNPGVDTNCLFQEFIVNSDGSTTSIDVPATRWLSGVHECEWVGISCSLTSNVVSVDLGKSSKRDVALSKLLKLSLNELFGQII